MKWQSQKQSRQQSYKQLYSYIAAMEEAEKGPASGTNTVNVAETHRHNHGGPALTQPFFNWNAPGKYVGLLNFEMEVVNMFLTKTYELNEEENCPIIKICLWREGLQLIQTFTNSEK